MYGLLILAARIWMRRYTTLDTILASMSQEQQQEILAGHSFSRIVFWHPWALLASPQAKSHVTHSSVPSFILSRSIDTNGMSMSTFEYNVCRYIVKEHKVLWKLSFRVKLEGKRVIDYGFECVRFAVSNGRRKMFQAKELNKQKQRGGGHTGWSRRYFQPNWDTYIS